MSLAFRTGSSNRPINFNQSALADYIERLSVPASDSQISRVRTILKRFLETSSLSVVVVARGGMVMSCITGAGYILDQPTTSPVALPLGIASGTSVVICFGAMSAFTMLKVIHEITRVASEEEKVLASNDMALWKKTALTVISISGGLIAQVPLAYVVYKSALALPLTFAIFQFLDCGRTAYSINATLLDVCGIKMKDSTPIGIKLEASRNILLKAIKNFRRALADKNTDHIALLNRINEHRTSSTSDFATEETDLLKSNKTNSVSCIDFISEIMSDETPYIPEPPPINKAAGWALNGIGLTIAGVVLSKFWQLAGQAAQMVTEDETQPEQEAAYYTSAAVVTLANAYLWITLVNKSTRLMADVCRRAVPPIITEKLHGRVHKAFTYIGVASSCLTFVPQFYFAELAFPSNPYLYYPIGILSSLGTALGGAGATFALRDILLARFTKNVDSKQALELDSHLQQLLAIIPKMKSKEFAGFLLYLNEDLRRKLESPSKNELAQYTGSNVENPLTFLRQ